MSAGKLAAQAGHAYDYTIRNALSGSPEVYARYCNGDNAGSKVTLEANNVDEILNIFNKARELDLPCSVVVDQHHILPPHFTGEPIITALGIGPVSKAQSKHILRKLRCVK